MKYAKGIRSNRVGSYYFGDAEMHHRKVDAGAIKMCGKNKRQVSRDANRNGISLENKETEIKLGHDAELRIATNGEVRLTLLFRVGSDAKTESEVPNKLENQENKKKAAITKEWFRGVMRRNEDGQGVEPGTPEYRQARAFAKEIVKGLSKIQTSKRDVAANAGISYYTLLELEQGTISPRFIYDEWISGLAQTLGLSKEHLRYILGKEITQGGKTSNN